MGLKDKLLAGWDLEVKGPIFIKRMWAAWRASREILDLRKYLEEGKGLKKEGCMWLLPKEES